MSTKQVIIHKEDVIKILEDANFKEIEDYTFHMKDCYGLSPYKKDIKPATFTNGLGERKMNHYSIRNGKEISENYRYYIINKRKWMLCELPID
jgi:hypothetical protein